MTALGALVSRRGTADATVYTCVQGVHADLCRMALSGVLPEDPGAHRSQFPRPPTHRLGPRVVRAGNSELEIDNREVFPSLPTEPRPVRWLENGLSPWNTSLPGM